MQGSLEPVNPKYITPKKTRPGETSPDYSPAYPVEVSPIRNVKEAAEIQSRQEKFQKDLKKAKGGKKTRKTKKSRRQTRKRFSK